MAEIQAKTGLPLFKIVGPLVAAGKQKEIQKERLKHKSKQKALMTMTEFKEHRNNYEAE